MDPSDNLGAAAGTVVVAVGGGRGSVVVVVGRVVGVVFGTVVDRVVEEWPEEVVVPATCVLVQPETDESEHHCRSAGNSGLAKRPTAGEIPDS